MKRVWLTLAVLTVTSMGAQTSAPLTVVPADGDASQWVVTNQSLVPMTAVGFMRGPQSRDPQLTYFDAAIGAWPKIEPGKHSRFSFREHGSPMEAQFQCAIFADGSTVGEAGCLERALQRRRDTLAGLDLVLQHVVQKPMPEEMTVDQLIARLHRGEWSGLVDARDRELQVALGNISLWVQRRFTQPSSGPPLAGDQPISFASVVEMLQQWRQELGKSRPSLAEQGTSAAQ
jgi:hypothetical protein